MTIHDCVPGSSELILLKTWRTRQMPSQGNQTPKNRVESLPVPLGQDEEAEDRAAGRFLMETGSKMSSGDMAAWP